MKNLVVVFILSLSCLVKAEPPKAYLSMKTEFSGTADLNIDNTVIEPGFLGKYDGLEEVLKNHPEALSEYETYSKLHDRGNWIFLASLVTPFILPRVSDSNVRAYLVGGLVGVFYGLVETEKAKFHFYRTINLYNGAVPAKATPTVSYTWTF